MLKNFSDYLSLLFLIIFSIIAVRFFIISIIPQNDEEDDIYSRKELLKDYLNNTEE